MKVLGTMSGPAMTQELKNLIHTRANAVQREYHRRGKLFRGLWLVAAVVVIAAGLLMTVMPGPAIIVIPIGVAMLAARFRWAQWLLRATIEHGVTFHRWLNRAPIAVRAAFWLSGALVAGGFAYLLVLR
jgi:tellurite resistance protein TerC